MSNGIKDPWPLVATNFRPTPELRWKDSRSTRSMVLQQKWIRDDGMAIEWRKVPTVPASSKDSE